MELTGSRETVLHYFELIQRKYPEMQNFYARERGDHVLEENKELGTYRWCSVEKKRICSGFVNPDSIDSVMAQNKDILDLAPHALSVSPLDCESLNVMFGFDFTYSGNHNQLIAEALGVAPAFEGLLNTPASNTVAYEPAIQFAISEDCKVQCRINVESRTSAYHIRTSTFPEEQLSCYVTARRFGSLPAGKTYVDVCSELTEICIDMVDNHVMEQVLVPLQQTFAMK